MNQFTLQYTVEQEMLLRDYLAMHDISKRTLAAVKLGGGNIYVNEIERNVRYIVQPGDLVKIVFPKEERSEGLVPEDGPLQIVYEDEALLVIQKDAGMSTIPSAQHRSHTIANYVAGKFARENIPATVHIVTRLDLDTSGLICIAKNRHIHHILSKQIQTCIFERTYEAVVEGHIVADQWTTNEPIGRKDGSIIERMVRADGQHAITHGKVLKRIENGCGKYTHIALTLETGRTHQIRVHMQSIGHSLVGDDLYGGQTEWINRQALHCKSLTFYHPITKKKMTFTSPTPPDIYRILHNKSNSCRKKNV